MKEVKTYNLSDRRHHEVQLITRIQRNRLRAPFVTTDQLASLALNPLALASEIPHIYTGTCVAAHAFIGYIRTCAYLVIIYTHL